MLLLGRLRRQCPDKRAPLLAADTCWDAEGLDLAPLRLDGQVPGLQPRGEMLELGLGGSRTLLLQDGSFGTALGGLFLFLLLLVLRRAFVFLRCNFKALSRKKPALLCRSSVLCIAIPVAMTWGVCPRSFNAILSNTDFTMSPDRKSLL